MDIQRVRKTKISNFKSARSLQSTSFVRAARALLCPSSLELGVVGIYDREDYRILRQSKFGEYIIIDKKVGDDHRS